MDDAEMEILGQSTKTVTPRPYTHLGYIAASPSTPQWGFFGPGLLLLIAGLALALRMRFSKTKRGFTAVTLGVRKEHKYVFHLGLFLFVVSLPFLFLGWIHRTDYSERYRSIVSGTHLKGLYAAFAVYANEHENRLPPADRWCDVMIVEMDVSPQSFTIPGIGMMLGESAYAMNQYVKDIPFSQLPPDIVLLFETNAGIGTERSAKTEDRYFHSLLEYSESYSVYPDRWNQAAGPESIKANYHKDTGANFLFGSGRVTFVKPEEFPSLKWQPSESSSPDL